MSNQSFSADPNLALTLFKHRFTWSADNALDALWWSLKRAHGVTQLAEVAIEQIQSSNDPRQLKVIDALTSALISIRMEIEDSLTLTDEGPWSESPAPGAESVPATGNTSPAKRKS